MCNFCLGFILLFSAHDICKQCVVRNTSEKSISLHRDLFPQEGYCVKAIIPPVGNETHKHLLVLIGLVHTLSLECVAKGQTNYKICSAKT